MRVLRHLRKNLVAYLALFVALGGTSYAAKPLLTGADLQDGTVASIDVKDADLAAVDVAPNALTGAVINESTLGGVDADKLDGRDSTEFALAADVTRVAAARHWGPMSVSASIPEIIGDPLVLGGWSVVPTCSGTGLSIRIAGPGGYTKTITRAFGFAQAAHDTRAYPELTETPMSASLLLTLDYDAVAVVGAGACIVRAFAIQATAS
jgi:hypothetical protein